jgi:type I restriction enzyme S subunit
MTQEKKHSGTGQDCPEGYKSCDGYRIPKEWHIVRFDSLFSRVTRKNDENNQNVLTISAQQGLISQIEYYNTLYASENKTGYTLLHRGDFSYNKSYSSGYAYGAIKRLDAYEKGIVSPLYLCFTPRQGVNSDFYLQYFEAGCFDREIYKIAQEGARNHGLLNVSTEDFFHSMLVFPPLEEQKRITEILTQCDHVIELKEQKLDELKQLKKEFLRKMFPAKGCDTPEIRFPGFTGAWEQRKLGEIATFINGRAYSQPELLSSGKYKVLRVGNFYTNDSWYYSDLELGEKYYADYGDLLYTWSATFGPHIWLGDRVIYHYHIWKINLSDQLEKQFAVQLLEQDRTNILSSKNGSTMVHITKEGMEQKDVIIPPSTKEQQEIGAFFLQLDNLITLHQRELEETKTYKKTLAKLLLTGIVRVQG